MKAPANWFLDWFNSPYYYQLYAAHDDAEAVGFIEKLLQVLQPAPGSRMLDLACGRGRHARILAAHGFDVTGLDIAPNSINYAKKFEQENLHFFQHDMRLPFHVNYFDTAFNFFTSFGYFQTDREHQKALRAVGHSLKQGGRLVLDYLNSPYAAAHLVTGMEKEVDGVRFMVSKWQDATHFYKSIRVEDKKLNKTLEFMERVAKFTIEDFTRLCTQAGLQIVQVFGDYNLQPYREAASPRLILIAARTH